MVADRRPGPTLTVDLSEAHLYFCYGPDRGALPCPGRRLVAGRLVRLPEDRRGRRDRVPLHRRGPAVPARARRDEPADHGQQRRGAGQGERHEAAPGHGRPAGGLLHHVRGLHFFYRGGVYRYNEETSGEYVGGHCVCDHRLRRRPEVLDRQELLGHRVGRRRVLPDRLRRGRHRRQHVGHHRNGEVAAAQQPARGRGPGERGPAHDAYAEAGLDGVHHGRHTAGAPDPSARSARRAPARRCMWWGWPTTAARPTSGTACAANRGVAGRRSATSPTRARTGPSRR